MLPRQKSWRAFRGGLEKVIQRRSTHNTELLHSRQQEPPPGGLSELWCQLASWIPPRSSVDTGWYLSIIRFKPGHRWQTSCHCLPCYHLTNTGCYFYPVANCVFGASMQWNLCQHFLEGHPLDLVVCPSEESTPLPRITRCGMQMAAEALLHNHQKTKLCMERWGQRMQHETAATA